MAAGSGSGDGLLGWLVGGLVVGAIVLGALVGAYAIGYDRGQDSVQTSASHSPPPAPPPPPAATTTTATGGGDVAAGKKLFVSDACASCHSLNGTEGVGPTMKGLAGRKVSLDNGTTVTADTAYIERSIVDPDAQIVAGFQKGVMSSAVSSFDFASKPADVAALVAFLETQ